MSLTTQQELEEVTIKLPPYEMGRFYFMMYLINDQLHHLPWYQIACSPVHTARDEGVLKEVHQQMDLFFNLEKEEI